ncbi:glycosyltransferase [Dietzia sp. UCD-THP]|uniref:glycosyltransferase n=1 Tax=Dietzia sp. UCD-THP TaxID=1292020 RepID=UPI00036351D3|nr:glycosyltransferase [Dietzia sp. UCD-THP]
MTHSHSASAGPLRVRSIPAGHAYVRHALGPAAERGDIVVLADPLLDPGEPTRWWPHPALEAADHPEALDGTDLVHVHFGFEHRSPRQIAEFVAAVRTRGVALVVTVHDLTNPHEPDPAKHLERTGILVRGADAVITLTAGSADEIRRRWGADSRVVPHPRLMPVGVTEPHRLGRLERAGRTGPPEQDEHPAEPPFPQPSGRRTVGVALGSLRAGVAAEGLLPRLADALPSDADLVVMVRSDALAGARAPGHTRHEAAHALDTLTELPHVEVRPHDLLTDDELCRALSGFDALVLPHRHGTHSGWLELCRDLGLPPVIPDVGYLIEQWGHPAVSYDPIEPTVDELRRGLAAALSTPPVPVRAAAAEDGAVAAAHAELYRTALAAVASRRAGSS